MTSRMSLHAALPQLLHDTPCVSFYEALAVVQTARQHDSLADDILQLMLYLHDASHVTDGARGILGDFLRAYQGRIMQERYVGARPLTLKDHGKLARVAKSATLVLLLDERRAAGFTWTLVGTDGDPVVTRLPEPPDGVPKACFEFTWEHRGRMYVTLREDRNDGARPTAQRPRQFELTVLVE